MSENQPSKLDKINESIIHLSETMFRLVNRFIREDKKFKKTIVFMASLAAAGETTLKFQMNFPFKIKKIRFYAPASATVTENFTYEVDYIGSPVWAYPDAGQKNITCYEGQSIELDSNKNFQAGKDLECYMKNNYASETSLRGQVIVEVEEI